MSNKEENIVKRVCRELNITQKELSDLMGVNDGTPAHEQQRKYSRHGL